jgi:plasmid stability protein
MQYTIRGIPQAVDQAARARARAEGRSLNEVAVEALVEGLGLGEEDVPRRDLFDIAGTWKKDEAMEAALAAQDRIDKDLWK